MTAKFRWLMFGLKFTVVELMELLSMWIKLCYWKPSRIAAL